MVPGSRQIDVTIILGITDELAATHAELSVVTVLGEVFVAEMEKNQVEFFFDALVDIEELGLCATKGLKNSHANAHGVHRARPTRRRQIRAPGPVEINTRVGKRFCGSAWRLSGLTSVQCVDCPFDCVPSVVPSAPRRTQ